MNQFGFQSVKQFEALGHKTDIEKVFGAGNSAARRNLRSTNKASVKKGNSKLNTDKWMDRGTRNISVLSSQSILGDVKEVREDDSMSDQKESYLPKYDCSHIMTNV